MNLVKIVVAVCAVIFFACLMIPNKIEIKINHHHDFSGNYNNSISMRHDFDFGGNLYKPICIQVGNQATVPLKVDVNHR
jgi:hypothetical protein